MRDEQSCSMLVDLVAQLYCLFNFAIKYVYTSGNSKYGLQTLFVLRSDNIVLIARLFSVIY